MVRGEQAPRDERCIEPAHGTPSERGRGSIGDRLGRLPGMHPGAPRRNVLVGLVYLYLFAGLLWASTAAAATLPVAGAALVVGRPGSGGR